MTVGGMLLFIHLATLYKRIEIMMTMVVMMMMTLMAMCYATSIPTWQSASGVDAVCSPSHAALDLIKMQNIFLRIFPQHGADA